MDTNNNYQMDLADKGLLIHLLGNYKWQVDNQLKNQIPSQNMGNEIKRLQLEMEMIERANEIIHDIP